MNKTNILEPPETKQEKIFYYLFDNGEQPADKLVEVGNLESKDAFYKLKQRQNDNIKVSRIEGKNKFYDLSLELKEQIQLKISQKEKQIEQKDAEIQSLKEQELKQENILISIKNLISKNKALIKRKENDLFLDLKELLEFDLEIFEELKCNPETTKKYFEIALNDFGFNDFNLKFSNIDILKIGTIESLRNTDIDKLQLLKVRVASQSDVRPQVIKIKFECPSCGTIISVLQIDSKIREPTRCSCGRRGFFKEIHKDLVDRARIELQDLTDLTESPQTREISGFVFSNLTEAKELSKLNPGCEVKVLGILRGVTKERAGIKTTSLDLFFEILTVEPFEEVIDLDSFTEQEIIEFKELSNTIKKENSLKEIRESFAPDIIGNEEPKDALILKSSQGKGRENKSNIIIFSNPGLAKSRLGKKYNKIVPGSSYTSCSSSSAVGLTASVEKKQDGWICKPGVLPLTKEDAILDEQNLMNEEELPKLQEGMSEGCITINKASIHTKLKVDCGIISFANPVHGVFDKDFDIVRQFNLPPQILNRYDAVLIIEDNLSQENDEKIAKQMLLRNENKINQKYSDEFLKRYLLYVRNQKEPIFPEDLINNYIPKKYSKIRQSSRLENNKILINARFIESIIRFSKSIAKIKLNDKVSEQDVDFVLSFLQKTCLNFTFGK